MRPFRAEGPAAELYANQSGGYMKRERKTPREPAANGHPQHFTEGADAASTYQDTDPTRSPMTVAFFVENIFIPDYVAGKTLASRTHYHALLKHIIAPEDVDRMFRASVDQSRAKLKTLANWPYLGNIKLRDVKPEDIRLLVSAAMARGYAPQTVTHILTVVGTIFGYAAKKQFVSGDNPASGVTPPVIIRRDALTLTLAQAEEVLRAMRYPEKEMTLFAMLTSMKAAEICGLQWKHLNMTEAWIQTDGEPIPPNSIAVRKRWYLGELRSAAIKSSNINLPIPAALRPVLSNLSQRPRFTGPDDFVFTSRAGKPINTRNIGVHLRQIGEELQMPWLAWRVLRRTHKTLAQELGAQFLRQAFMTNVRAAAAQ